MNESAIKAFELFRQIQNPSSEDDYVFATSTGEICSMRNIERTIYGIQKEIGFPKTGVHVLRHTYISMMKRGLVNDKVIAQNVGQSGSKMINNVYYHVLPEEMRQGVESIFLGLEEMM